MVFNKKTVVALLPVISLIFTASLSHAQAPAADTSTAALLAADRSRYVASARHEVLLNNDTIPDYFEYQCGSQKSLSFKFYDGATRKEIRTLPFSTGDIPYGKKHVSVDCRVIDVDSSDGHREILLRFQASKNEGEEVNYTMAVFRYDERSGKMKVIFSHWFLVSTRGPKPDPQPLYFSINHIGGAFNSIVMQEAERQKASTGYAGLDRVFDFRMLPKEGAGEHFFYFNPASNIFLPQ